MEDNETHQADKHEPVFLADQVQAPSNPHSETNNSGTEGGEYDRDSEERSCKPLRMHDMPIIGVSNHADREAVLTC